MPERCENCRWWTPEPDDHTRGMCEKWSQLMLYDSFCATNEYREREKEGKRETDN